MAGQCCRFTNDFPHAIEYLKRSAEINPQLTANHLSLGIIYQLMGQFQESIGALVQAIQIDRDYGLAYNSLAFTQEKMGQPDKALHNYEVGIKAQARKIAKRLTNSADNQIFKHRFTRHNLWLEYALFGAVFLCAALSIRRVLFPSAEMALHEEMYETHAGLYWFETKDENGEEGRCYLPNYLNTFREILRSDPIYFNMMFNWGILLQTLGRETDAMPRIEEAEDFRDFYSFG